MTRILVIIGDGESVETSDEVESILLLIILYKCGYKNCPRWNSQSPKTWKATRHCNQAFTVQLLFCLVKIGPGAEKLIFNQVLIGKLFSTFFKATKQSDIFFFVSRLQLQKDSEPQRRQTIQFKRFYWGCSFQLVSKLRVYVLILTNGQNRKASCSFTLLGINRN